MGKRRAVSREDIEKDHKEEEIKKNWKVFMKKNYHKGNIIIRFKGKKWMIHGKLWLKQSKV